MKHFRVKNFERFQHYKDRSPPWIKLYNELLEDYEFSQLPDAAKMHLIGIWLLASRSDNRIPYDAKWVAARINATEPVKLDVLRASGFIEVDAEQDASNVRQSPEQVDRPEREGETERETEGEGEVARSRAPTATRLPDDWAPDSDLLAWAVAAEPGVDAKREAEKFRDYWKAAAGANARKRDWSAAWRTWIRRAAEIQSVRPPPPRAQARDGPAKSSGGGLASISEAGEAFLERVAAEARARQKQAGAAG